LALSVEVAFSIIIVVIMLKSDESDRVREVIERHNATAVRCYATGDIDTLVSLCAEDVWQMPPNSPPLVGREAIHAFWTQAIEWGKWEFTFETQDVQVSGRMAVERGKYVLKFTASVTAPPGMKSFEDQGNYLAHWRLEPDGEWRIVADAPVSELPLNSLSKR
jgi:uncharacterized protein (TIGR02246 family)